MDRFSIYLLGALAAVLIAFGVVAFLRQHEVAGLAAEPTTIVKTAAPLPPASRPLFASGSDAVPMAPGLPNMPAPAGAPVPTRSVMPVVDAASLVAMPTPIPWSPPNYGKVATVIYPGFTVVYSTELGNPAAVQYAMVQGAKPKRYPQPVKVKTPSPKLIANAGYAAGTMAFPASISLYFGKQAGNNTSLMPNLCAFDAATLAGPWTKLADLEVQYASVYKWIEIVTGPIFATPPTQAGGIIAPAAFYRVYRRSYGDCMAFIIPQGSASTKMETYLTNVTTVEAATGLPIFANTLSQEARDQIPTAVW
jgi:DNA/RNA endonuclease G (NUC1)